MQYIPIQRKACWLVSSITRQYGRCCLSFLSMSLLAGLFGRTNSRTSGNDVLRELHRLTRYQLRWHWCGRHGGRGKLVSTRTYLQILGTSTDYSSPSVLLFTDSYRWLSFLFIYLFIYLFIFWQQLQNTSLFGHLDAFKRTIHFESISSFLHAPSIAHTVTGRFVTTSAKLFLLF